MIHLDTGAGLNDLLSGDARFDDIIQRFPEPQHTSSPAAELWIMPTATLTRIR